MMHTETPRPYRVIRRTMQVALSVVVGLLVLACHTLPDSIGEDVTAPELIRLAQEAYSDNNYDAAFFYYYTLLERYSENRNIELIATYEIAFLHYKAGEHQDAQYHFDYLLAEYQRSTQDYPLWVYRLAQVVYPKLADATVTEDSAEDSDSQ